MALDMTPEEKATGMANLDRVAAGLGEADKKAEEQKLTRRKFMQSFGITAGVVAPLGAAAYFRYKSDTALDKGPVKAALIGAGDEGGVLMGEHNPAFLQIIAVCDIRPSNRERIFTGDLETDKAGRRVPKKTSPRKGLVHHYG